MGTKDLETLLGMGALSNSVVEQLADQVNLAESTIGAAASLASEAALGIDAVSKGLTDHLAGQAALAESVASSLDAFRDQTEMASRWAQDITDQQSRTLEYARDLTGSTVGAALDAFREQAEMASRWAQAVTDQHSRILEYAREQTGLYDVMTSTIQAQVSEHLAAYAKLVPEWKAMEWSVIDNPLLEQMAEAAQRQTDFFDQLGLETPEAAAEAEIFYPRLDLPIPAPQHPDPEPVLAEFFEAQGEAQLTLGKLTLRQGMWAEAESHFKKAAKWLEHSAEPYIGLGFALNAQGEHARAVKAFERAERRDPECFSRPDVRAAYEASLQERRWDGKLDGDSAKGN